MSAGIRELEPANRKGSVGQPTATVQHHYFGNGKFRNVLEQWERPVARSSVCQMGSSRRSCLDKRARPFFLCRYCKKIQELHMILVRLVPTLHESTFGEARLLLDMVLGCLGRKWGLQLRHTNVLCDIQ